ncbi:hypothetical protein B0H15DRAFT_458571 [Mycena belliarum]|uniref:Uncharacterized protein n=1 Tax=Mycena belliarum TaxID=1033014 RepID=A0AAD6XXZ0_9AGAR|nr:hypothetical protein B0H15DRAFT_458571 [Mycena belliae]
MKQTAPDQDSSDDEPTKFPFHIVRHSPARVRFGRRRTGRCTLGLRGAGYIRGETVMTVMTLRERDSGAVQAITCVEVIDEALGEAVARCVCKTCSWIVVAGCYGAVGQRVASAVHLRTAEADRAFAGSPTPLVIHHDVSSQDAANQIIAIHRPSRGGEFGCPKRCGSGSLRRMALGVRIGWLVSNEFIVERPPGKDRPCAERRSPIHRPT